MPTAVIAEPETRERTRLAPRQRVLLHDDDVTPMDFVTEVLRGVFGKPAGEAEAIMLEAHRGGVALVEVVPLELAELHVDQARSKARTRGYPLAFSTEPAD